MHSRRSRLHRGPRCAQRVPREISDNRRAMTMRVPWQAPIEASLARSSGPARLEDNVPCAGLVPGARHPLPPWRSRSARSAEAREVLVRFQGVGRWPRSRFDSRGWHHRSVANAGVAADSYSAFTWVRFPPDLREDRRTRLRAPTSVQYPVSSETTKQVKCCGDTPVRHTGVVGFNSHHLLDPTGCAPPHRQAGRGPHPPIRSAHCLPSSAGSSGRMVRGRSPVRFRREARCRLVPRRAGVIRASLAQQEAASAS